MNLWIWSRLWNLRRNLAAGNTLKMKQRREERLEVSKTSPASELLKGLCLFVAEFIQFCSCFLCAHWITVDMKEHNNFLMKICPWREVNWPFSSPRVWINLCCVPWLEGQCHGFPSLFSQCLWWEHGTPTPLLSSPFLTWKMGQTCWHHKGLALINYIFPQHSDQPAVLLLKLLRYRSSTLMRSPERCATPRLHMGNMKVLGWTLIWGCFH